MEKKIQDFLHLYLGCGVEYTGILNGPALKKEKDDNKDDIFYLPKIQEIVGLKYGFLREIRCSNDGNIYCVRIGRKGLKSYWSNFDNFKLILRPLSDMTHDEWIKNWTYFSVPVGIAVQSGHLRYSDKPKHVLVLENRLNTNTLTFNDGMILMRMGFDLFGLIESGLAIDRKALKL